MKLIALVGMFAVPATLLQVAHRTQSSDVSTRFRGLADTTVMLGQVERELTGDGTPETLRLVGVGPTIDSLDVTFTIETGSEVLYRTRLRPITRTIGYDAGRRVLSESEHRAHLAEFATSFFDSRKFMSPPAFVDHLRSSTPGRVNQIPNVAERDRPVDDHRAGSDIWGEINQAPVTVFTFSPGGDAVHAIGWSNSARRFYQLLECC